MVRCRGLSRRHFLGAGVAVFAATAWGQDNVPAIEVLRAARKKASARKRRIVMNNDGNDVHNVAPDVPKTVEQFLERRTSPLIGSEVDSIFYCTGVFNLYSHRSEESEPLRADPSEAAFFDALYAQDTDPLGIVTKFGHENGLEVFWSMRMNDTHDSGNAALFCRWKQDHPECLVGRKDVKYKYGCNRWSSVDYGAPEVREKVFRILRDVCMRYDVDGVELDFFRHPVLFRAQMTGEPVTQSQCDELTALVTRIRRMTEEIGLQRGRPMLVGIRIPDSVGYCRAIGIDLVRWLEEDLIDLMANGDYFKLEPWTDFAALGHRYEKPVYACFESRRLQGESEQDDESGRKIWRGEALEAWKNGVDGIYTFNRFDPRDPLFRELGDPALLETLDRTDRTTYVAPIWSRPETWLKDGRRFLREPETASRVS